MTGLHRGPDRAALLACLASPAWADAVLATGPPYGADPVERRDAWLAAGDAAFAELPDAEVAAALAAHPRIGQSPAGAGADAESSRREQAQVSAAPDDVLAAIAAGNQAYERRFDRVFLIRAAGRSPGEILAELERRLGNDDATEFGEAREQLRQITALRLERLVTQEAG